LCTALEIPVVLMVTFSRVKHLQFSDLGNDRVRVELLLFNLVYNLERLFLLLFVGIEYGRFVLRTNVIPLSVLGGRVMHIEEYCQKVYVTFRVPV
jgi:hypothetical protein